MSRPLSATVYGKYDMPSMRLLKNCGRFDIGLPETRSGRDRYPPHLGLETISARNGSCPVPQKSPPESSVPGGNLTREGGGINSVRGHGSPSVLNEVFFEFSTAMPFEECKQLPVRIHSDRFPSRQPSTGDGRLSHPPHHTGHGGFRTRPPTSVKSPFSCATPLFFRDFTKRVLAK